MEQFDAVVVGAGPAGSTAARELAVRGVRTLLLEREQLPRVKLCAGWVTFGAFRAARLEPRDYPRTLQAFHGGVIFELGADEAVAQSSSGQPVCYGIIRSEFDEFLARRAQEAGAVLRDATAVRAIRRAGGRSGPGGRSALLELELAGGSVVASPLIVGAGGNFCPVARFIDAVQPDEVLCVCHEREIRLGEETLRKGTPHYGAPELFGIPDGTGYGWIVTKGPYLNLGIGVGSKGEGAAASLKRAQESFLGQLRRMGRFPGLEIPALKGHAYKIWDDTRRRVVAPGVLLVGDAGGFAANFTGEGIRPAIESGALAAEHGAAALAAADCSEERLSGYDRAVEARFGRRRRAMFSMRKLLAELGPAPA